jgi:hypothetical protein
MNGIMTLKKIIVNSAIVTAGCFVCFLLLSSISYALPKLDSINTIFQDRSVVASNLKIISTYNGTNSKVVLSSFVPVADLVASSGSLEKMKKIDNSTNLHNSFYDNFEGGIYPLTDGQISPNGKWKAVYAGYGSMGVTRDTTTSGTTKNYFFEHPKTSISYNETRGSLVTTSKAFSDFKMTLNMKTVKQLRQNSPPKPWETAWVFWHYTDAFHNYVLVLKTNGLELQKKDNNNQCDACQIYLLENHNFPVKLGQWQTITLRVTNSASGTPHIKVWVNGVKAADFVDKKIHQPNSPQLSRGYVGLYCEDSLANFDNVKINPLR